MIKVSVYFVYIFFNFNHVFKENGRSNDLFSHITQIQNMYV